MPHNTKNFRINRTEAALARKIIQEAIDQQKPVSILDSNVKDDLAISDEGIELFVWPQRINDSSRRKDQNTWFGFLPRNLVMKKRSDFQNTPKKLKFENVSGVVKHIPKSGPPLPRSVLISVAVALGCCAVGSLLFVLYQRYWSGNYPNPLPFFM